MAWFESPQYLKGIQKLRNMDPSRAAVTQVLLDELGGLYAQDDIQKQVQASRMALRRDAQDKSIDLGGRRLELSGELGRGELDISKKNIDFMKKSGGTAEALGYGNIFLSGLAGYSDMKRKKEEAAWFKNLMERAYPGS